MGRPRSEVVRNADPVVADRRAPPSLIRLGREVTLILPARSSGKACLSAFEISSLTISPHGMAALIGSSTSLRIDRQRDAVRRRRRRTTISVGTSASRKLPKSTRAKSFDS